MNKNEIIIDHMTESVKIKPYKDNFEIDRKTVTKDILDFLDTLKQTGMIKF